MGIRLPRFWTTRPRAGPPTLAYPYYVDEEGLRGLADSLGIELPVMRQRTSSRRARAQAHGVGVEGGVEEGQQLEGHIHLNVLATRLLASTAYREIIDVLGLIPSVHDEGILDAAIGRMQNMPLDGEERDEFVEALHSAYQGERLREITTAKRLELEQVAKQNQLVILRGSFDAVEDRAGCACIGLTHLEPAEFVVEPLSTPDLQLPSPLEAIPMPEDVGIEAVLPAGAAFTDAGRERLGRGAPFYGRLIGHSASYDGHSGVLTCSAYAVWGMPRPAALLNTPRTYQFLEG